MVRKLVVAASAGLIFTLMKPSSVIEQVENSGQDVRQERTATWSG